MNNTILDFTFSYGKLYISIIMALFMCIIEIFMYNLEQPSMFNNMLYAPFLIALGIMIYMYRDQAYIKEKDFLKNMIEHHSMAIFTSSNISKKTEKKEIKELANNIINNQQKEIDEMKKILKNI
jgi:membrane protein CcdC involved in cytochrome C biogenesis